jgi:hypothetical protein
VAGEALPAPRQLVLVKLPSVVVAAVAVMLKSLLRILTVSARQKQLPGVPVAPPVRRVRPAVREVLLLLFPLPPMVAAGVPSARRQTFLLLFPARREWAILETMLISLLGAKAGEKVLLPALLDCLRASAAALSWGHKIKALP